MVAGLDQTFADRGAPVPVAARLCQRVSHRRQLVDRVAPRGVVELGLIDVVAREVEEPRGDRTARWAIVAPDAAAGAEAGAENDREGDGDEARAWHSWVFGSARVAVKEV